MQQRCRRQGRAGRLRGASAAAPAQLPPRFLDWFCRHGWRPRAHQLELLAKAAAQRSTLLIAPPGAGKTLAGFLPSLVRLAERAPAGPPWLHTLYVSPLKALTTDIERNLLVPLTEMALPITVETRTGDTSLARKQRQRRRPPDMFLTTPEQVALLLSHANARELFLTFVPLSSMRSMR